MLFCFEFILCILVTIPVSFAGQCRVTLDSEPHRPIRILRKGDMFGEINFLVRSLLMKPILQGLSSLIRNKH
jgi:hypothetical protein